MAHIDNKVDAASSDFEKHGVVYYWLNIMIPG